MATQRLRSIAGVAASFLLLIGCGDSGRAPASSAATNNTQAAQAAPTEPAEQVIERLEREWATAQVRKDLGWYDRHVAPDYQSILSDGGIVSRADMVAHLRSSPPSQALKVEAIEVRAYGDSAVATVTQSYTTASGKAGRSRITDVWVKSGGRWMVHHSHEGPIRG